MRVFSLDRTVKGLVFDMDSTLYENPAYAEDQVASQVRVLAARWNRDARDLQVEVYQRQEEWAREHGGRLPSFGNLLLDAYGIGIAESVALREEAIEPERWLAPDPRLRSVLQVLAGRFRLAVLTNNPVSTARRSLRCLGVEDFFPRVVGLDTTLKSKPSPETFLAALKALGVSATEAVSVGDRYPVDIEPALALGMGGVLVESMEDIYSLGALFSKS